MASLCLRTNKFKELSREDNEAQTFLLINQTKVDQKLIYIDRSFDQGNSNYIYVHTILEDPRQLKMRKIKQNTYAYVGLAAVHDNQIITYSSYVCVRVDNVAVNSTSEQL